MGCFSFIDSWLVKKKQMRRQKKLEKQAKLEKKQATPRKSEQDEVEITKKTTGGVAFEIELEDKPKLKPLNAPPPKPAKTLLDNAQARAIMADIKRRDALMRKGEAAREAERKREEYAKRRAEENRRYQERARAIVENQVLPDDATVKANLNKLAKRCKTARRRKQITDMLTPHKSPEPEKDAAEGTTTAQIKTPDAEAAEGAVTAPTN